MKAPTISVRELVPEDADGVSAIEVHMSRFLRQFYRPTQAGFANRRRISNDLTRLVAVVEGRVVGTTQYYIRCGCIHLLGLGVDERYRSRGVGRALVEHVSELAKGRNAPVVRLSTVRETGNVPIFERFGFCVAREYLDDFSIGISGDKVTNVDMERA